MTTNLHIFSKSQMFELLKRIKNNASDSVTQKLMEIECPYSLIFFENLENASLHAESRSKDYCNDLKMLKLLLDLGMLEVNTRNKSGETMLHLAARGANSKAMKLLLDNGADTDVQSDLNETPLFFIFSSKASNERKRECCEILMLHGANYGTVNGNGETVVNVALKNGSFFGLQPIVAHLAWLKELDLPFDRKIFGQIQFVNVLRIYYQSCRQHLEEMKIKSIYENITEFEILTENEERIASYMRNAIISCKLEHHEVDSDLYYRSLFKRQIFKAIEFARLRIDASIVFRESIKLFQDCSHIIIDKIVSHLNHDDLLSLMKIAEEEEDEM